MTELTAQAIFRGSPVSDDHMPNQADIVTYLEGLEKVAALSGALFFQDTIANLNSVSGAADGDTGFVLTGNSGVYKRVSSVWVRTSDLPRGFAFANIDDTSDVNKPVSAAQGEAILAAPVGAIGALPSLATFIADSGFRKLPCLEWRGDSAAIWLNGRTAVLSDVTTDNGDGSFDLTEMPLDLDAGLTVYVEYSTEGQTGTPSGTFVGLSANKVSLSGEVAILPYTHTASGTLGVNFANRMTSPVSSDNRTSWGANRAIISVPATGNALLKIGELPVEVDQATATYVTPTFMTLGGYARNTRSPLTNANIERIVVYSGALSADEIDTLFDVTNPDYGADQVEVPCWVPRVSHESGVGTRYADLSYSYARGRCWFNGREREFDDVFVDPDGGDFTLIKPPRLLTTSSGITHGADIRRPDYYDETETPSGQVLQTLLASGIAALAERIDFEVTTNNVPGVDGSPVSPGGLMNTTSFIAKAGVSMPVESAIPTASTGVVMRGWGIHRHIQSVPVSGAILTCHNAGSVKENATVSSYVPQDLFRFGAKVDGTGALANAEIDHAFIFSQALTSAQMDELKLFTEYGTTKPRLYIGDSGNNVQQPAEQVAMHYANAGHSYLPWWSDGKGSRGLNFFEEFIEAYVDFDDLFRDYVLDMHELGFDYSSLALDGVTTVGPYSRRDVITMLHSIRDKFRETDWLYMEAHSNLAAENDIANGNTALMTQLRQIMSDIKDTFPEAFVPTNAILQSQATTDADYETFLADGRTPSHLRDDSIHISIGTAFSGADSGYFWWKEAEVAHHSKVGVGP